MQLKVRFARLGLYSEFENVNYSIQNPARDLYDDAHMGLSANGFWLGSSGPVASDVWTIGTLGGIIKQTYYDIELGIRPVIVVDITPTE